MMKISKKVYKLGLMLLLTFVLCGCSTSDKIIGKWYGANTDNVQLTVEIDEDELTASNDSAEDNYSLKQVAVGVENGIRYYGLTLNGNDCSLIFPEKDNDDIAFLLSIEDDEYLEGSVLYILNKKDYPDFDEYKEKYFSDNE